MEQLKSSMSAKILAMILITVSLVLLAGSAAGMLVMDSMGGYQTKKSEMLQKGYDAVCGDYSVMAMSGYQDDFEKEELSDTNFFYGVVKADSIEEADFQNLNSYIGGNFDSIPGGKIPQTGELHFEEYDVNENTAFYTGNGSIMDAYYAVEGDSAYYTDEEHPFDGYFYDPASNEFYACSGKTLYPVGGIIRGLDEDKMTYEAADFLVETDTGEEAQYRFMEDTWAEFDHGGQVSLSDIKILKEGETDTYKIVTGELNYIGEDSIHTTEKHELETEHYIVASFVRTPLTGEKNFRNGDMFMQVKLAVDFAYSMRYPVIFILVLSLAVLTGSFVFLMSAAGHRKGQEGISAGLLDKLPLDLYFVLTAFAEWLLGCIVIISGSAVSGWSNASMSGLVSFTVVSACAGITGVLFMLAFFMSISVHVKLGKWWRHTVTYWIYRKCMLLLRGGLHLCLRATAGLFRSAALLLRSIAFMWKVWLVLGLLAFVEFVVLMNSHADGDIAEFWLLEKMILYPFLMVQLMQLDKLQKGAQKIADGALDYQIDTRHMFWEIKKHGEYLNDIGKGINSAVNERMKSEHFKTELITNVSHDIKTPLTSIINYVDLLQKEEIDNPVVQEYLEVLHRQSARLKKLIEDLMEASKASTGSLHVDMEKCEAGVMLIQTVGEFEEKLMHNQIELQIKKPETDLYIQADNRHLWRVFDNLMNNICKYAQPSTRAYVNLMQQNDQAVITFRNISKYQLNISSEELMERFVRGDSSRNTDGSGLGISIAKSLTELMNGTFELVVDGDLFKVTLTFPLYDESQPLYLPEAEPFMLNQEDTVKKEPHLLEGIASGIQTAGMHAAGLGKSAADKTGRAFRQAGRFAHHVKQAAIQAREEEEELEKLRAAREAEKAASKDVQQRGSM